MHSMVRLQPIMCAPALCQGRSTGLQLFSPQIDQLHQAVVSAVKLKQKFCIDSCAQPHQCCADQPVFTDLCLSQCRKGKFHCAGLGLSSCR